MNVDHGIEVRLGHFVEVDVLGIACVIHEVIEPFASPAFERFADIRDELVKCAQIARVQAKCHRLASHGLDVTNEGLSLGLSRMIGKDYVDAASGEVDGCIASHATACARYNRRSLGHSFDCLACHLIAPFRLGHLPITLLEQFRSVSNDIYPLNPANRL